MTTLNFRKQFLLSSISLKNEKIIAAVSRLSN